MIVPELPSFLPVTTAQQQAYGLFGDYIGGFWGTVASAAALFFIFRTWLVTRQSERRSKVISILSEMLKTHDQITNSEGIQFISRTGTPSILLREFSAIYGLTQKIEPSYDVWSSTDRIDISYIFAYYGPTMQAADSLKKHDPSRIKIVHDSIARYRERDKIRQAGLFKGHQISMSHYMRNLYSMYRYIDKSPLNYDEKVSLGKVIKSKLSNYEQGVLALNVMSHLGTKWERNGIISKYKPFSNIPKMFFTFDEAFSLKDRFPQVAFEWEGIQHGDIRYGQWELGNAVVTMSFWART
jgi:hypothetical protein